MSCNKVDVYLNLNLVHNVRFANTNTKPPINEYVEYRLTAKRTNPSVTLVLEYNNEKQNQIFSFDFGTANEPIFVFFLKDVSAIYLGRSSFRIPVSMLAGNHIKILVKSDRIFYLELYNPLACENYSVLNLIYLHL